MYRKPFGLNSVFVLSASFTGGAFLLWKSLIFVCIYILFHIFVWNKTQNTMGLDHYKTMDDYEYFGWTHIEEDLYQCECCMEEFHKDEIFTVIDYEGKKELSCEECADHPDVISKTPIND